MNDDDLPVLTQVLRTGRGQRAPSIAAPVEALGVRSVEEVALRSAPVPHEDPAALALRIRDAVLEDLRTRIDPELDARIAHAVQAEVETAVAQLQINLRTHLGEALRDVVQRAVDEQVSRIPAAAPTGAG